MTEKLARQASYEADRKSRRSEEDKKRENEENSTRRRVKRAGLGKEEKEDFNVREAERLCNLRQKQGDTQRRAHNIAEKGRVRALKGEQKTLYAERHNDSQKTYLNKMSGEQREAYNKRRTACENESIKKMSPEQKRVRAQKRSTADIRRRSQLEGEEKTCHLEKKAVANQNFRDGLTEEGKEEYNAGQAKRSADRRKSLRDARREKEMEDENDPVIDWKGDVDLLLDKIERDPESFFRHFETSPLRSVLLWHLNAGYAAFRGVQEEDTDDLVKQILDEKLDSAERFALMKRFFETQRFGTDKRLPACGCCGIREADPSLYHMDVGIVSDLDDLQLSPEELDRYGDPPEGERNPHLVEIVANEKGDTRVIDTRDVYSCYKARSGKRYHIHPELVSMTDNGKEVTDVCKKCMTSLAKKKPPKFSIIGGVDFGNFRRLGLEEPNVHEKAIISQIRKYIQVVKISLQRNGRGRRDFTLNELRAHVILFADDTTGVVRECWKKHHIETAIRILMITPEGKVDSLYERANESSTIVGRSYVVHQWLTILDAVSAHYGTTACPTQTLPPFWQFHKDMLDATKKILDEAEISTSPSHLRFEAESGADVAGVRKTNANFANRDRNSTSGNTRISPEVGGSNVSQAGSLCYSGTGDPAAGTVSKAASSSGGGSIDVPRNVYVPLRYSMVTKMAGVDDPNEPSGGVGFAGSLLKAASTALYGKGDSTRNPMGEEQMDRDEGGENCGVQESQTQDAEKDDDDSELSKYDGFSGERVADKEPLRSVRENEPLNEYAKDDFIFGAGFPWVFPTGIAYRRGPGTLTQEHRHHLLHQFTNIPAHDRHLCTYLFDARKRAETNSGVCVAAKQNRGSFEKVKELIRDQTFRDRLAKARKDPKSKESKDILRKLLGVLNFSGKRSSFGALERNEAVTKVCELSRRYGCPSVFLTMSFDDINNPLAFRLSLATTNRDCFPSTYAADNGDSYIEKLLSESEIVGEGSVRIPTTYRERAKAGMENPIAYVTAYKDLLHDILSLLIGLPPNNFDRSAGSKTSSSRRTKYYKDRVKGIFGRVLAIYGVTEEHAKGTLHNHFAIYGGLHPRILQRYAAFQEVCDAISEVLDSMYSATLPDDTHHHKIVEDVLAEKQKYEPEKTFHMLENIKFCQGMATPIDFSDGALGVSLRNQHADQQRHGFRHNPTCTKGMNGKTGCRLCKPSGECKGTHPVVLEPNEEQVDEIKGKKVSVEPKVVPVEIACEDITIESNLTRSPVFKSEMDKKLVVWELNRPSPAQPLSDVNNEAVPTCEEERIDTEIRKRKQIQLLKGMLDGPPDEYDDSSFSNAEIETPTLASLLEVTLMAQDSQSVDKFYKEVRQRIPDANGMVTENSPMLSKLAGCHNAAMILGSMEQGKSALFYIASYIAKSKVAFEQCFVVLEKALEHVKKHPSKAADSGTPERETKHVLERTLNQLNLMMEISDYQAAAALVGLPTEITTDIFRYFSPRASIAMVDFELNRGLQEPLWYEKYLSLTGQPDPPDDIVRELENGIREDEEERLYNESDVMVKGKEDPTCKDGQTERVIVETVCSDNSDSTPYDMSVSGTVPGFDDDFSFESDAKFSECDDNSTFRTTRTDSEDDWSSNSSSESSDSRISDDGVSEFATGEKSDIDEVTERTPFYVTPQHYDSLGYAKFYTTKNGVKVSVPESVHWRFRGSDLRHLTRFEYAGLVKIVPKTKGCDDSLDAKLQSKVGRRKSPEFCFGKGHPLRESHSQVLLSKQSCVISCQRPPRFPGEKPRTARKGSKRMRGWLSRANKYAKYALVLFRPEPNKYDDTWEKTDKEDYTWEAFVTWFLSCQKERSLVSLLRLRAMETHLKGISTDFQSKVLLSKYRGRNRKLWKHTDHERFEREDRLNGIRTQHDGSVLDDVEFERLHSHLGSKVMSKIYRQLSYCTSQRHRMNKLYAHVDKHTQGRNNLTGPVKVRDAAECSAIFTGMDYEEIQSRYNRIVASTGFDEYFQVGQEDSSVHRVDLSQEKYRTGNEMQTVIRDRFREIADEYPKKTRKPILVTGPPGVGKSHLAKMIQLCARETFGKRCIPLSFNGIAAVNIGGDTVSGAGQIHFASTDDNNKNKSVDNETKLPPVTKRKNLEELQRSLAPTGAIALIVDEISTVSPVHLAALSERCQQATGNFEQEFGGLIVILMGDFSQLAPVHGACLPNAVVDILQWDHDRREQTDRRKQAESISVETQSRGTPNPQSLSARYAPNSLFRKGCDILRSSEWYKLTEQMRSKDKEHDMTLAKMERSERLSLDDFKKYQLLTETDLMGEDSLDWISAPILVATNRERHNLIGPQCKRFAAATGKYVFRWPVTPKEWEQKPHPAFLDDVMEDPCFYEWFVEGADGFITDRINKSVRLVNGTRIKYHSIVPASNEQRDSILAQMAGSPPGSIIFLSEPPYAINVELVDEHSGDYADSRSKNHWKHETLEEDRVIIPILPERKKRKYNRIAVPGGNGYLPSRVKVANSFPLEMAFAITIHKAQGRTMKKVVLALSDRLDGNFQMTYASLYVALSRVAKSNDIRLLLNGDWNGNVIDRNSMKYITGLEALPSIMEFFAGYRKNTRLWNERDAWLEVCKRLRKRRSKGKKRGSKGA